ncbi:MAG TPA: hypothetical protein VFF76_01995 [Holophagaceae bacterium]|jgi:Tfp pilus assembly protein PilW|nr:hypothetical protein [Holophagaceae bacterium]
MSSPRHARPLGFSLVELLIALVFVSFLMAGMLRIYGSAIQGFAAANESAKAQRDNRWAQENLSDDLQAAGYFFFYAGRPAVSGISVSSGSQNPLMLFPGQTITNKAADPANPSASPTSETITFDELQFLRDDILPVTAQLSAQPVGSGSISVTLSNGDLSQVKAGDFAVLMDAAPYQMVLISAAPGSGTTGTVPLSTAAVQDPNTGAVISSSVLSLSHQAGVDVVFVRTYQVVRYTVMPLSLDPSNTAATVPCMVRDEATYPGSGALIAWPAPTATAAQLAAANVTRTVIAENVTGLRFDMSLDQGATWTRGADWTTTQANLNAKLSALASAPGNAGVGYATTTTDPINPLWYRNAPLLFRADVTTRTVLKRTDYSATANVAAYRSRTQTFLVQPRNFGLGI